MGDDTTLLDDTTPAPGADVDLSLQSPLGGDGARATQGTVAFNAFNLPQPDLAAPKPAPPKAGWPDIVASKAYQSLTPDDQEKVLSKFADEGRTYLLSVDGANAGQIDNHLANFVAKAGDAITTQRYQAAADQLVQQRDDPKGFFSRVGNYLSPSFWASKDQELDAISKRYQKVYGDNNATPWQHAGAFVHGIGQVLGTVGSGISAKTASEVEQEEAGKQARTLIGDLKGEAAADALRRSANYAHRLATGHSIAAPEEGDKDVNSWLHPLTANISLGQAQQILDGLRDKNGDVAHSLAASTQLLGTYANGLPFVKAGAIKIDESDPNQVSKRNALKHAIDTAMDEQYHTAHIIEGALGMAGGLTATGAVAGPLIDLAAGSKIGQAVKLANQTGEATSRGKALERILTFGGYSAGQDFKHDDRNLGAVNRLLGIAADAGKMYLADRAGEFGSKPILAATKTIAPNLSETGAAVAEGVGHGLAAGTAATGFGMTQTALEGHDPFENLGEQALVNYLGFGLPTGVLGVQSVRAIRGFGAAIDAIKNDIASTPEQKTAAENALWNSAGSGGSEKVNALRKGVAAARVVNDAVQKAQRDRAVANQTEKSGLPETAKALRERAEADLRRALDTLPEQTNEPNESVASRANTPDASAEVSNSEGGLLQSLSRDYQISDPSQAWENATYRGVRDALLERGVSPESVGWSPDAMGKVHAAVLSNFSQHGQGRQELLDRSLDVVRNDLLSNATTRGNPLLARNAAGEPVPYSINARLMQQVGNAKLKLSGEIKRIFPGEGTAVDIAERAPIAAKTFPVDAAKYDWREVQDIDPAQLPKAKSGSPVTNNSSPASTEPPLMIEENGEPYVLAGGARIAEAQRTGTPITILVGDDPRSTKGLREVTGKAAEGARDNAATENADRGQAGIPTHEEKDRFVDELRTVIEQQFSRFVKANASSVAAPDATPAQILRASKIVMDQIGEHRTGQTIGLAEKQGGRPSDAVRQLVADEGFRRAVQEQIFDPLEAHVREQTDKHILEKPGAYGADNTQSLSSDDKAVLVIAQRVQQSGVPPKLIAQMLPAHLRDRMRSVVRADGLKNGTGEVLKRIAALKTTAPEDAGQKLLAKALIRNGASFEIHADPTLAVGGADGVFEPRRETIRLNPFLPDAQRRSTILHEHTHGILAGKTEAYLRGDYHYLTRQDITALDEIDALRKHALQHVSVPERIRRAAEEKEHSEQMKGIRAAVNQNGENRVFYGLVSLHEFMAEALTNPEFQAFLNRLPDPKAIPGANPKSGEGSVWSAVKRFLRQLVLGGKPVADSSTLARAFDRTIDLVRTGKLEDQLVARFGEDFDFDRFEKAHQKSMNAFAREHGHESSDALAVNDPELYNEGAGLLRSISREHTPNDKDIADATRTEAVQARITERLKPLLDRIDTVRSKALPASDSRLDTPVEQQIRDGLANGRSSVPELAESLRNAGGLTEEQAQAAAQAIHSHVRVEAAGTTTAAEREPEKQPSVVVPSDAGKSLTAGQREFVRGLAEQSRERAFGFFGPGAASAEEFPNLREQAAREYATIGASHILEGAADKAAWTSAMREEYGLRDASDKELNKIWRRSNQFVQEFADSQTGRIPRPKRQIEESIGLTEPRANTIPELRQRLAESVSKADALAAYLSGMEKASALGAKTARVHVAIADKWLTADQEQVRRTMTEFVNKTLPPAERGRFVGAIGRALQRPSVLRGDPASMYRNAFRVMRAIESRVEEVYRGDVISDIKKTLLDSVDAPGIDVAYRQGLKALLDQISLSKPTEVTLTRLRSLQAYVDRERAVGHEPQIPKEELEQLSLLTKLPLRDMPVNTLTQLRDDIKNFVSLGRLKTKLMERAWERQREQAVKQLAAVPSDPIQTRELYRAQPTERLSSGQRFANAVNRTLNAKLEFEQAISPMDEIYDHLDGATGTYDGWASRNIKGNLDLAFNKTQAELQPIIKEGRDIIKRHDLSKAALETVGLKGILRMIGRERLEAMGVRNDILDRIEATPLTPGQQAYYNFTRRTYDALGDRVRDIAHRLYQIDMGRVPDYVPLMRDWAMHAEREAPEPLSDPVAGEIPFNEQATMRQLQHDMNPKVISRTEQGFLKARIEGAKTAVKVNAQEVFERHTNDALHFIHAQPVLKMLGEIVRKPDFAEKFGKAGQSIVLDHLDSVANQGYVNHLQRIRWLDWVRNSTSKGAVAFRLASNVVHASQIPYAAYHAGGANWWAKGLSLALTEKGQRFLQQHAPETYVRSGGEPAQADVEAISRFGRAGFFIARNIDKLNSQAVFLGRYAKEMTKAGLPVDHVLDAPVDSDLQALAMRRMHRAVASPLVKDIPQMTSRGKGVGGNVSVARAINQFRNIFLDNWSSIRHDILRVGITDGERVADLLREGEIAAGAKEVGDAASHRVAIAAAALMSIVLETGIKLYVKQGLQTAAAPIFGNESDDKKKKAGDTFHDQFVHHLINRVPFAGQIATAMMYGETGVPVIDAIVRPFAEIGQAALKSKAPETQAKHYVRAASAAATVLGVPGSSQALELAQPTLSKAGGKVLPDKRKSSDGVRY